MLVSIVVPVYNAEKYLDKCITSLLNQTYREIEIILVNDGSSDSSLDICKAYSQKDIRITVINKENGGASSARNAGIKVAKGEYVMFADADDFVSENYVCRMVETQTEFKDSFVICDLCGFLGDDTLIRLHNDPIEPGCYCLKKYYMFSQNNVLNQPVNKIFSMAKIKDNNIKYREDLPIGEDIYFNLEYLELCKNIFFVNEELYFCLTDRESSLCHKYYDNLISIHRLIYSRHTFLFELFDVDNSERCKLDCAFYGSHLDCLDREIANAKSKKEMFSKMKTILKSDSFRYCLNKCKSEINKKYYFMLKLKCPRIYYLYHKLSKMR